jgi:hypothetical protein
VWEKREEDVSAAKEAYDPENDTPNLAVDGEKEVDEASKEQEHGHVKQGWYSLDGLRQAECLNTKRYTRKRARLGSVFWAWGAVDSRGGMRFALPPMP